MRAIHAFLLATTAVFLGDVAAWIWTSGGAATASFAGMLAGEGAACTVGIACGGAAAVLGRAARSPGPLRLVLARLPSPADLAFAATAALPPIVLGAVARAALLDRPAWAGLIDLAAAGGALCLVLLVLRRRQNGRGAWSPAAAVGRMPLWLRAAPIAAAVACTSLLAGSRPGLLPDGVWDLVTIGTTSMTALGLWAVLPVGRKTRRLVLAGAGLAVVGIVFLERSPAAREGVAASCRPANWVLIAGSRLDLDGDGFSPVLGGGDCDDLDATVNPDAPEVPGNGRDENCRGGDRLARSPFPARPSSIGLPPPVPRPEHIVLVSIDALRPDHLGTYGYPRDTSPRIDEWARGAIVYRRAYTAAPYTRLALPVMLTGRTLSQIPWVRNVSPWGLPRGMRTLASVLRAGGWDTGAIATHRFQSERSNWLEGFDHVDRSQVKDFHDAQTATTAHLVVDRALEWQRAHASGRSFLWLHLFEPHNAYVRHEGIPDFGPRPIDLYDGEIFFVDRAFGRLVRGLADMGISDRTAVVLLADHGEEFGEHGGRYHGTSVFEEVTRVPLLLRIPGLPPGTIDCPTSSLDVATTLLDLAGLDGGREGLSGATLLADLKGCDPSREIVTELRYLSRDFRALIGPRYKLVQDVTNGTFQLYDLDKDPGERKNVAALAPRVFRRAKRRLLQWVEHAAGQERLRILRETLVSEVPPAAMPVGARFANGIELVAADLGDRTMSTDRTMVLELYWRVHAGVHPGCRIETSFLDARGRTLRRMRRRLLPLSGLLGFDQFPQGRMVRDTRHQGLTGRHGGKMRAMLALICEGERVPVTGGERPIAGDRVDLGEATGVARR